MQKHKVINVLILISIMLSPAIVIQPNISEVQADTRSDEYIFHRSWGGAHSGETGQ